jgi:hypothetical protein
VIFACKPDCCGPCLQDSLGGNAKTMIVANVSPSALNSSETSSTLAFVTRAKCIRNKATINLDYRSVSKHQLFTVSSQWVLT